MAQIRKLVIPSDPIAKEVNDLLSSEMLGGSIREVHLCTNELIEVLNRYDFKSIVSHTTLIALGDHVKRSTSKL